MTAFLPGPSTGPRGGPDLPPVTSVPPVGGPDDIDEWLVWSNDGVPPNDEADDIPSFPGDVPAGGMKPLRFRTAREIAEATSADVAFAAVYLAFGAITELDGKPKAAGKTTLILDLVGAVLDGRPFLGQPTVRGPVVMLTEQPTASLKAALVRATLTERDDFVLLSWADAAGTPWPAVVVAARAKADDLGARVIVVDTLPQFAGLRGDAENNAGDALEAIEPLQLLAADGFAILVSRHDRKAGGDVGDSARGSGAFTGAVDVVVGMSRNSQDARPTMRHLACLSRFSEPPPELVIELVNGRHVVLGTGDEELARARREHLLAALPEHDAPVRLEGIAVELDEKDKAVRALLNELLADGAVARHGDGVRGKPYLWSRLLREATVLPFVSLRETGERKETSVPPGPVAEPNMSVDLDYPRSAWAHGIEDA